MQLGAFTLRSHQVRCITDARALVGKLLTEGVAPKVLVVCCCGGGKTVISAAMIKAAVDRGRKVVFLAHGRQLIYQKSATLDKAGIPHAVLMAGEEDRFWHSQVIVASKDTYVARAIKSDRLQRFTPDLVIVDEAHMSSSAEWGEILRDAPVVIGLTATPVLPDGSGMGKYYNGLVRAASYSELIAEKLIVPARVFAPWSVDTRGLNKTNGDWSWDAVAERFNFLVGDVVSTWKDLGEGRPTAVFSSNVKHSVELCNRFNWDGIPAAHIDADTPQEERDAAFQAIRDGLLMVLCNFGVLTVGFDLPALSCGVLAFSTNSLVKYLQVAGRLLRPYEQKTSALIIDHGDNVRRLGWPTEDHQWTLNPETNIVERDAEFRERDKKPREPIACSNCGALREAGPTCHNCGQTKTRRGAMVKTIDGELREIVPREVRQREGQTHEQTLWMQCLGIAANRGQTFNQAMVIFKKKCGHWPEHVKPMPESHQWKVPVARLYPNFVRRKINKG